MIIQTRCTKCGVTVRLDFGEMSREEAMAAAEKMDETPRECPGRHVELGGFRRMWGLDDAIHRAYDLGESEPSRPVPTDREHVERLLAEGREIIDGGCHTVPELGLPDIHSFRDLIHLGFGEFRNDTHVFVRCDSPQGARFYERVAIGARSESGVSG